MNAREKYYYERRKARMMLKCVRHPISLSDFRESEGDIHREVWSELLTKVLRDAYARIDQPLTKFNSPFIPPKHSIEVWFNITHAHDSWRRDNV